MTSNIQCWSLKHEIAKSLLGLYNVIVVCLTLLSTGIYELIVSGFLSYNIIWTLNAAVCSLVLENVINPRNPHLVFFLMLTRQILLQKGYTYNWYKLIARCQMEYTKIVRDFCVKNDGFLFKLLKRSEESQELFVSVSKKCFDLRCVVSCKTLPWLRMRKSRIMLSSFLQKLFVHPWPWSRHSPEQRYFQCCVIPN